MSKTTAAIGILLAVLASHPAAAQRPAVGAGNHGENDQAKSAPSSPPAAKEAARPEAPPAMSPRPDDEFDPPPAAGCPYRDNKLDLLV